MRPFCSSGRLYDKNGNLKSWWAKEDEVKFKERAQCVIDQYDAFVVPGTDNMTVKYSVFFVTLSV